VQIRGKNFRQVRAHIRIRLLLKPGPFPRLRITLHDERARRLIELVRVRRKRAGRILAKRQRQSVEELVRAVPDVTMRAQVELRLELFEVMQADRAVHSIRRHQQITLAPQRIHIVNFTAKIDLDAQLFSAALENLQQLQPRDAGEAVTVNRDLRITMNNVDVVPCLELFRNLRVRRLISSAQVGKRLA
jgi:hypothetical protein